MHWLTIVCIFLIISIVNLRCIMQTLYRKTRFDNNVSAPHDEYDDANAAADRLENIIKELADGIRSKGKANIKRQLALPDNQFLMNMLFLAIPARALAELTPEKKRLLNRVRSRARFFDNVRENGGVLNSAEVASLLGVSKVTVKKKKDTGKLLALECDGEFIYPAFQFTDDESKGEKGVLRGVVEILFHLGHCSGVMQYGFFVQKRNVLNHRLPEGQEFTVIGLLKDGVSDDELQQLIRLAKSFGTQDAA
ncbi:hypothetical protein GPY51_14535 [Photorhabdus laumondii subsp. laumondii]|uniref:DNA-binding protein n=2 Tax=Photorhabdus TaxID=29487 RepID=A0A6L9JQN6_PHOLM|nr:hypothetical protein [Photorhabdus laumondii]NDK95621.1 hypothetical protein [Photorhabdus laumondii subsp. laumondii]MCC8414504.1 hypothetical protein [Photorhabdus laumondii]NDL21800.1 hypothetical protein [Photorhabdus laumondii subsp. laumondii]NDL30766.1 hypothetical protein [Photorhabdus laumondii subsp. laumondii]